MNEVGYHKKYFINLHCPYDIACIRYHNREYNFDNGGRLLWLLKGYKKIERSLNNRFVEKWDIGDDGIFRNTRLLTDKEAEILYRKMSRDLSEIIEILRSDPRSFERYSVTSNRKEVLEFISKSIFRDYQATTEDKKRFEAIYGRIEIFPSDLPMPLIVKLTEGCAYNECTFCGFYKDKPFRIKDLNEVKRHIWDIKSFLGESMLNRRSIFLGDANALMIEQDVLLQMLDFINEEFTIKPLFNEEINKENFYQATEATNRVHSFGGIYSFIDAFHGKQKSTKDFRELKERNIRRIYIGMESGSNRLLAFIKKCNKAEDVIKMTNRIKEAGISLGIMLIAGLGGKGFYDEHLEESIRIINSLNLDSCDNIYFSHLFFHEKASYKYDITEEGIQSLSYEEENQQIREIVAGFDFDPFHSPDIKGYEIKYVRF
ncbi:MAG: radical SAM protein [bacterium]